MKENQQHQEHQQHLESSFSAFLENINPLYQDERQRLLEKISLFRQKYSFLKGVSVLEYLNKEKETNHSKVLAGIWKNNPKILCDFIQSIRQLSMNEQLKEWILGGNYNVETEQKTHNKKFIDILITDNQKRYCIAIENKINSVVSHHEMGKLQLDSYYEHINKLMPKDAVKLCVLLSHRNNKKYTWENDWIYADYLCVLQSLLKNHSVENNILTEYLITVFSLLFPDKEIGENINEESSIVEMEKIINLKNNNMELSKLSIKCLENMPMLTETMASTVNELYNALYPYYEYYCELLNKEIDSDKQNGFKLNKVKASFAESFNKTLPLSEISMNLLWEIFLVQNREVNPISFSIYFGYDMLYENQNYVFFNLSEISKTSFVKNLIKSHNFIKSKTVSQEYQYINFEDETSISVQFTIDETLSLERIKTCSELFKSNILMPILNQLK